MNTMMMNTMMLNTINNNDNNDSNDYQFDGKLSVYIPRISVEWAQEAAIANVFHRNELGVVERVDLVCKQDIDGNTYYQAFVHMVWWDTDYSRNIQSRIADPSRQARIVHDDPNYWILLKNNNPMTATEVRLEKQLIELETRIKKQEKVSIGHFNRIMKLESQATSADGMNYWNDPSLNVWKFPNGDENTNEIAPLWCSPVYDPTPRNTPSWYSSSKEVNTSKTMDCYSEDSCWFQSERERDQDQGQDEGQDNKEYDNVCDYYDYDPYDMQILE